MFDRYDRVVLLVRHPFHQILAFTDWKTRNLHNNTRLFLKFYQHFLDDILETHVQAWQRWHETILKSFEARNICVMIYERLNENVLEELEKCARFLGFDIHNPSLRSCILTNHVGRYQRKARPVGETQLIRSFLSEKTREKSEEIYQSVMKILLNHTYHPNKCM